MTTPNEIKPAALAEGLDGGRCAVDAGSALPWQPIETAPTDGTQIALWCPTAELLLTQCRWDAKRRAWTEWAVDGFDQLSYVPLEPYAKPTHWLRITPPTPRTWTEHNTECENRRMRVMIWSLVKQLEHVEWLRAHGNDPIPSELTPEILAHAKSFLPNVQDEPRP